MRFALRAFPILLALIVSPPAVADDAPTLDTLEKRLSYAVGVRIGQQLADEIAASELDKALVARAISEAISGAELSMTEEQIVATFAEKQAEDEAAAAAQAAATKADGLAFLAENGKNEGITTTGSGLQYRVDTAGAGDMPTAEDTVRVHYTGRLLDGTVFDSSVQRGEPATFPVGGVIQGWQEVLQLMKPGAKWEVWIPSEIAYGPSGAGEEIGPNETLNFTIELLEIVKQ